MVQVRSRAMAICIVVNGPSSVGKSTLVTGLQDSATIPLLRFGVDELYRMVPSQWAGGTTGARHADRGFSYVDLTEGIGSPLERQIRNGADAVHMLHAMNEGILAMCRAGHDVIVDGQAYEPTVNEELHRKLRAEVAAGRAECSIVELTADEAGLADRQLSHPHASGLAVPQARRGWICHDPDLHLDTAAMNADTVLRTVWEFLGSRHPRLRA